ncbi:MAG: SpoIIIAH-like family protein [Faecalibacterium sp.]|nr:SpoIIIAH-like family protein [Ruminococcus sp.]MCM1392728.1 SpoIIIAH-like family protein [Ruminococcus sp.]MCM1485198.1 SpoIIIAH-like family protein [Faecalibacterium sp.]
MLVKKKQVLTATLIIALAAAVGVNWYYSSPDKSEQQEVSGYEQQVSGNLGDSLLVAGSVQVTSESDDETTTADDNVENENYFADAKLKRTQTHDKTIEEIQNILETENITQLDKEKINLLLSDYQNSLKAETDCENLITAKTNGECLVIINDNNAQVILQKNTLNDSILLQITEIIEKNTDISAENLTIIETK